MKKNKLVHGVGINDADYVVHKFEIIGYVDGKGKQIHLGYFTDPQEAHLAWKSNKHSLALQYADELEQEGYNSRLIEALRVRYL